MPYRLSSTGRARRETLHPDLQLIVDELLEEVDFTLICAHRTQAEQDKSVADGVSKTPWPRSKHNAYPSEAMDIAPYFKELGGIDWEDIPAIANLVGRAQSIAHRLLREGKIRCELRWGGDWDGDGRTRDQGFMDYVHLERVPLPED